METEKYFQFDAVPTLPHHVRSSHVFESVTRLLNSTRPSLRQGTQRYCNFKSMSLTLIQRRNKVVCLVAHLRLLRNWHRV